MCARTFDRCQSLDLSSAGTISTDSGSPPRTTCIVAVGRSARRPSAAEGRSPARRRRRRPRRSDPRPAGRRCARGFRRRPRRPRSRSACPSWDASLGGSGREPPAMPMYARRKRPSVISAPTIFRVASSIGTASPSPRPATAVLIPITRACESASAPPELPGLSAASVWITLSTTRPARNGQRAAERRDDAGGHRSAESERASDRDHELADAQPFGVAELGRVEAVRRRGAAPPGRRAGRRRRPRTRARCRR